MDNSAEDTKDIISTTTSRNIISTMEDPYDSSSSSLASIPQGKGKAISRKPPANLDRMPMEILQEIGLYLPMPAHAHCFAASCRTAWASLGSGNQLFWFMWFKKVAPKKTSRFNPFVEIPVNTRKPIINPSFAALGIAPAFQGPLAGVPAPQAQPHAPNHPLQIHAMPPVAGGLWQGPVHAPAAVAPPQAAGQVPAPAPVAQPLGPLQALGQMAQTVQPAIQQQPQQQHAAFMAIVQQHQQHAQPAQGLQIAPAQPPAAAVAPNPPIPPQGAQTAPAQMPPVGAVQAIPAAAPAVVGGAPGGQPQQQLTLAQQLRLEELQGRQRVEQARLSAQQRAIRVQAEAFEQAQIQGLGIQVQDKSTANQVHQGQEQVTGNSSQSASVAQGTTGNAPQNSQQNDAVLSTQDNPAGPIAPSDPPSDLTNETSLSATSLSIGIEDNHGSVTDQYDSELLPAEFQVTDTLSHQQLHEDPFKRFSPTFDYYNYAVMTLTGTQIEHRCQGCLTPTMDYYPDGERGNMKIRFTGVEFTSWQDEKGREHIVYHHQERAGTRRYYCKKCILLLLEPNVQDTYLGVDISTLSYVLAGEIPQLYGHSASRKWYLKSDLKKAVERATGCSIADLRAVAAAEEEERIRSNDDTFWRIANGMLDKLEKNPLFSQGLLDREVWLEELMYEWDLVSKWCLWGLSAFEKTVKMNSYVCGRYPNQSFYHLHEGPERRAEIFTNDLKHNNLFGRLFLNEAESIPVTDAETELAAESMRATWEEECVKNLLLVWPGIPLVERQDRKQNDELFINKAIWSYASAHKFTADMAGIAGLCPYCKVQTYYTTYGFAIHMFQKHQDKFYVHDKWLFRSEPLTVGKRKKEKPLFKKVQLREVKEKAEEVEEGGEEEDSENGDEGESSQPSAKSYPYHGPVCYWNEEKHRMQFDRFEDYDLVKM